MPDICVVIVIITISIRTNTWPFSSNGYLSKKTIVSILTSIPPNIWRAPAVQPLLMQMFLLNRWCVYKLSKLFPPDKNVNIYYMWLQEVKGSLRPPGREVKGWYRCKLKNPVTALLQTKQWMMCSEITLKVIHFISDKDYNCSHFLLLAVRNPQILHHTLCFTW